MKFSPSLKISQIPQYVSISNYKAHVWVVFAKPTKIKTFITDTKVLKNQVTVSTAKRLASSTIDTLHNTINGYKIAYIWNSKYNVHVCMIQKNSEFIFQKLIVFVS